MEIRPVVVWQLLFFSSRNVARIFATAPPAPSSISSISLTLSLFFFSKYVFPFIYNFFDEPVVLCFVLFLRDYIVIFIRGVSVSRGEGSVESTTTTAKIKMVETYECRLAIRSGSTSSVVDV